jgi:tRNA threonylcarbamoyladenosine biosynthesis protein TsaE
MKDTRKIILESEQATDNLAKEVSQNLILGDVIALYGPLGAGKTFFTQRLCQYLDVRETVSSPSYVLMNEYQGKFPIAHLDLYRLGTAEELLELGLFELFEEHLTIIEWAEIAEDVLPENTKKIRFELSGSNRIVYLNF